jgi:hypothetical protein
MTPLDTKSLCCQLIKTSLYPGIDYVRALLVKLLLRFYSLGVPCTNSIKQSMGQEEFIFVIPGFRRDVDEICALLGCYSASSVNPLPSFRDNISVPTSMVNKSSCNS